MKFKLLLSAPSLAVLILFSCNNNKELALQKNLQLVEKHEIKAPPSEPQSANKEKIPSGPLPQNNADSSATQKPLPSHTGNDWDKRIIKNGCT